MEQVRQGLGDEDKSLFLHVFATANPSQPAELPGDAGGWRKAGKGLLMRTKFCFVKAFERDLRDIDGATHFQGIAMKF